MPAPGLFLLLLLYVLEDWKHASQHKASGYLPVSRGGSPEEPAAGLAGLRSAGTLSLGSHPVNSAVSVWPVASRLPLEFNPRGEIVRDGNAT